MSKGLEAMRKAVAKLDDTSEGSHFKSVAFLVGKKMFATYDDTDGAVIQLEPDHAATLVERDPRFKPYTRAKHCVMFDPAGVKELPALVRESYDLIVAKAKKKPQRRPAK